MKIHFLNHREWGISTKGFSSIVSRLKKIVTPLSGDLNVVFVDDAYITKLNQIYRGKNKPTDVLSFNYDDESARLAGEIYISVDTAKKQAKKFRHTLQSELNKLFVHGFLHIHGYNHENEKDYKLMRKIENDILNRKL